MKHQQEMHDLIAVIVNKKEEIKLYYHIKFCFGSLTNSHLLQEIKEIDSR